MATIRKYLKTGLEIISIHATKIIVKKLEAAQRRAITLKKPEGFPPLLAGHAFIAEELRGRIYFYY